MGCVIKYKRQSIPEEQFLQHLNKQIAINNLFNEDKTLANSVYEALGFKTKSEIEVSNRIFNPDMAPDGYSKIITLNGKYIGEFALLDVGNEVHLSGSLGARTEINTKYRGKGYGYQAYVELAKQVKLEGKVLVSDTNMTEDAIRVWEKLVKEGYANKVKRLVEGFDNFEEEVYIIDNSKLAISEITPTIDLLLIEESEIPKKEGESFSEMQRRVKQNINIRKRIDIANKNNIKQGQLYSFSELKNLLDDSVFENDIYNDLQNVLPQVRFRFGSLNTINKKRNGYYDSNNNTISLEILHLTNNDFKRTLLHEIIHAATFINLEENATLTNSQKIALNNLNNLIEELKKDKDFFGQYGLKNANELLAELSNKQFVDKLKNKTFSTNQSFFDKIVSEIVKLLGLNTTAYDIVKESFDNLVKEYKGINQITPQQKAREAQQLYSQYLDTIFPDSKVKDIDNSLYNSILNQLEQENKIEKDCTGGGKLKAKNGISGKFTKGSQWEIYEIFEGKSHKQGGIEINIKNNQINFTNKNGSIKAKYGLVISKDS